MCLLSKQNVTYKKENKIVKCYITYQTKHSHLTLFVIYEILSSYKQIRSYFI